MVSASTPRSWAFEPRLLELDYGMTPDDVRFLEEIRSQNPMSAEQYLAWLDDCSRFLPPSVNLFEPTEKFDRPFELPPDDRQDR